MYVPMDIYRYIRLFKFICIEIYIYIYIYICVCVCQGVNCNLISGQGFHVTPHPNPTGPTSSTRLAVGPVWSSITG